jgi:plasmid stability protein
MYPGHEDKMPEENAERTIHIRMDEDLHKRLRIRCAELDTTIQNYVVELLDRELSEAAPRRSAKSHASPGRR